MTWLCLYNPYTKKVVVCIKFGCAPVYYEYTRAEIIDLIKQNWHADYFQLPIYKNALQQFPIKESK